jgi:hypothetical protein
VRWRVGSGRKLGEIGGIGVHRVPLFPMTHTWGKARNQVVSSEDHTRDAEHARESPHEGILTHLSGHPESHVEIPGKALLMKRDGEKKACGE